MKAWHRSLSAGREIAKALAHFRLFLNMATVHAPIRREKELLTSPVRYVIT